MVIRCTDLPATAKDQPDPYVKMQLLPEKQHKVGGGVPCSSRFLTLKPLQAKTRVLRKTQNPTYNEEFTFYGVTPNLLESLVVHFVVLNFDRFSRDEIVGEVVCHLNQFEFDSLEKQITLTRDIAPRGNKVRSFLAKLERCCDCYRLPFGSLKSKNSVNCWCRCATSPLQTDLRWWC